MFRTILVLGRVSNLPTVWTNVLAGWFLAGGMWDWELAWVIAGVSLLYVAGMTLNDAFDAAWDREHAPERPIPSGAISPKAAWFLGFGQLTAGIALLLGLTGVDPIWVAALVAAILLYDWIHKMTPWSVLVMGACRALVYLVAASTVAESAPEFVWVAAGLMGIYVVGISLAARGERTGSERSTESITGTVLTKSPASFFLIWLLLTTLNGGIDRLVNETVKAVVFVAVVVILISWFFLARSFLKKSIQRGVGLLIAGIVLIDGAWLVYSWDWSIGIVCALLLPITLLLQRKIPAT